MYVKTSQLTCGIL
jgi:hypothetical protein